MSDLESPQSQVTSAIALTRKLKAIWLEEDIFNSWNTLYEKLQYKSHSEFAIWLLYLGINSNHVGQKHTKQDREVPKNRKETMKTGLVVQNFGDELDEGSFSSDNLEQSMPSKVNLDDSTEQSLFNGPKDYHNMRGDNKVRKFTSVMKEDLGKVLLTMPEKVLKQDSVKIKEESKMVRKPVLIKPCKHCKMFHKENECKFKKCVTCHKYHAAGDCILHCYICNKTYKRQANLRDHIILQHTSKEEQPSLTCPECGKVFSVRQNLVYHCKVTHKKRDFACELCPMAFFKDYALKAHLEARHMERIYSCPKCCWKFATLERCEEHFLLNHGDQPRNNVCDECGKTFITKKRLGKHKILVHSKELKFECDKCQKKYRSKGAMTSHHWHSHGPGRNKIKECKMCEKLFTSEAGLRQHMQVIHRGVRYECPSCRQLFTCNVALQAHIAKEHCQERELSCPHGCTDTFAHYVHLQNHINIHHTEPTIPCAAKHCQMFFKFRCKMQEHFTNVHTQDVSVICDLCNEGLSSLDELENHLENAHGIVVTDTQQSSHNLPDFEEHQLTTVPEFPEMTLDDDLLLQHDENCSPLDVASTVIVDSTPTVIISGIDA